MKISKHDFHKKSYKTRTSARALCISVARSSISSARTFPVSSTSGITLAAMRIAINKDAIGSNPVQP